MFDNLNDAAVYESGLAPGKTEIWYMTEGSWRELPMFLSFTAELPDDLPVDPLNLSRTHRMLGRIRSKRKEEIFRMMQGDFWSPQGEARKLITALGLRHTSMSVGDIVVINSVAWIVMGMGFGRIGKVDE